MKVWSWSPFNEDEPLPRVKPKVAYRIRMESIPPREDFFEVSVPQKWASQFVNSLIVS